MEGKESVIVLTRPGENCIMSPHEIQMEGAGPGIRVEVKRDITATPPTPPTDTPTTVIVVTVLTDECTVFLTNRTTGAQTRDPTVTVLRMCMTGSLHWR